MAGLRPALVLSAIEFNVATGRAFACPITNQVKGGPWEIPIPPGAGVTGVVVVSEAKMIDWLARGTAFRGKARPETLDHVIEMIGHVLGREW